MDMQDLNWLPLPPENFNSLCAALSSTDQDPLQLGQLAKYRLNANQANRLYRTVKKLDKVQQQKLQQGFEKVKLGVVSNSTTDLITPSVFIAGLRRGLWLEVILTDFDQILHESQMPDSHINAAKPDLVLLMMDYRAFNFGSHGVAATASAFCAQEALEFLNQVRKGFREHSQANCIVPTLAIPSGTLLGNLDRKLDGSLKKEILLFNQLLTDELSSGQDYLLDINTLAAEIGSYQWFDERQWLNFRIAMSSTAELFYCEQLSALIASIKGKSKKCLVLDLDNTLWGGVIGDDGMDGIILGQGNPRGEAHCRLQRYAKELKSHGIILAVCSKNDEKNALQPFREHPDMLLKEEDIAIFVANWSDKASNIKYIAEMLNIGIDSLVFVDDNPAEREMIRANVPQVSVPELPTDPALYVSTLMAANYFEAVNFTHEDSQRAEQYRQNSERKKLLESTTNMDDYLASLEMVAVMGPVDSFSRKRVTQLINKTNQFNLTTQRYTESQVMEFEQSEQYFTLQIRLIDKFGDNGIVSVVICKIHEDHWQIDTWLMSCRVIKRRLEELVCDEIVKQAQAHKARKLIGTYLPTSKNGLVAELYPSLGFTSEDNGEHWSLDLSNYEFKLPPITVE